MSYIREILDKTYTIFIKETLKHVSNNSTYKNSKEIIFNREETQNKVDDAFKENLEWIEGMIEAYPFNVFCKVLVDLKEGSYFSFIGTNRKYTGVYVINNGRCIAYLDCDFSLDCRHSLFYRCEENSEKEEMYNALLEQITREIRDFGIDECRIIYMDERIKEPESFEVPNIADTSFEYEFKNMFSMDEYIEMKRYLEQYEKVAKEMIDYTVIPKLAYGNQFFLREKAVKEFEKHILGDNDYVFSENSTCNTENYSEIITNCQGVLNQIERNYLDGELFICLFQEENDFAKSYITSEWLYKALKLSSESSFNYDGAAIVFGYMKSIEQLLYDIAIHYRGSEGIKMVLVKGKTSDTSRQVNGHHYYYEDFTEDNCNNRHFDFSLNSLIDFMDYNYERISCLSGDNSRNVVREIYNLLMDYKNDCRNRLFHKGNLDDWEDIDRIRNNTYILYSLVLGAFCVPVAFFPLDVNYGFKRFLHYLMLHSNSQNGNFYTFKRDEVEMKAVYDFMKADDTFIFSESGDIKANKVSFLITDGFSYEEIKTATQGMTMLSITTDTIDDYDIFDYEGNQIYPFRVMKYLSQKSEECNN